MSRFTLYALALSVCTFFGCLAGPSLRAAPASSHPAPAPLRAGAASEAQDNSLPRQSGPGIEVCDPVTAPSDPNGRDFGAGCALWLQMTVGGQPQFGKTPLWGARNRAASEMHRPDLQLSPDQAVRLAPILGVTHAVVGTLHGSEPHLALTYRLFRVPQGTPVAAPVALTGTRAQIVAGLPGMARKLAQGLGLKAPDVPASPSLSPDDVQTLGRCSRTVSSAGAEEKDVEGQGEELTALAAHSPLAGLMSLSLKAYDTNTSYRAAVSTLLAQAGGNPLVWSEIAVHGNLALLPHAADLAALAARYPNNYNLAVAETFRCRAVQDRKGEMAAAGRITQDAPHNPDGWLTYARTISNVAEDLRQGRYYGALTPAETGQLSRLYPQAEDATRRAAHLDPAFALAWLRLATAATFTSDSALGDYALQTALKLSPDKAEVYGWGLEMYQPKWNDAPGKLDGIARVAAADTSLDASEVVSLARKLRSSNLPDLQQKILSDFVVRRRTFLAAHPGDGAGHWGLAAVLEAAGDKPGALAEYQLAATLLPVNAVVRYDLGNVLYVPGTYDQAIAQLQEAVRLDPDYSEGHFLLGYGLKHQGHYEEAKRELQASLRLNPAFGKAYAGLGDVAIQQNDLAAAIPNYQAAIQFGDYTKTNYETLVWALENTGQYDKVLSTGEAALRIDVTGDASVYDNMADACLNKKDLDKSIALSQAALALNAEDAWAHENLGEAYLGAGRKAEAQAEWKKVLTLPDARMKAAAEGFLKQYP